MIITGKTEKDYGDINHSPFLKSYDASGILLKG